jgi:hypothetical protein
MLQNRVDPFGNIIKTKARGHWMGNRGVLHDDRQNLIRPFKLNAWITCKLEFKGRNRTVMSPGRWTELFFLDEATSFAAGHRPCFECRREDAVRFKSSWLMGNPEYGFDKKTSIREIDNILHKERIDRGGSKIDRDDAKITRDGSKSDTYKITFEERAANIPDGAFVSLDGHAFLVFDHLFFLWTPFGYEKGIVLPGNDKLAVLTPRSAVNAFRAGYLPELAVPVTDGWPGHR